MCLKKNNNLVYIAIVLLTLSSCHSRKNIIGPMEYKIDKYGCNNSMGFVWSTLNQECIKKFEAGIKLIDVNNTNNTKETYQNAYLVLPKLNQSTQVELFIPNTPKSILLNPSETEKNKWTFANYILVFENNKYIVTNTKNEILYKQ